MRKKLYNLFFLLILFILAQNLSFSQDTSKIAAYNLLNYGANSSDTVIRHPYYRTVVQSVNPDILVAEEMLSQNAVNIFLNKVLNLSGIGTFQAGTFIDGYDSDNAVFYKSSKFVFISNTPIHTNLRDINEFKLYHIASGDTIRLYAVHLKASNTSADQQQRAAEVDSLRKVTNMLPPGSYFAVMGDFNIYSSNEPAYMKLKQVISGTEGHFIDALNLTGTWNNGAYALYHTQSTRTRQFGGGAAGGLDDRFDMILYSQALNDTGGITILPQTMSAYGNDGNHYNDSINQPPNTAVPQNVANALHYSSDHLPIVALFKFENVIGVKNQNEIASVFNLEQNYPNPFNPNTIIRYELKTESFVKLDVYNITGKLISNLVNKKQRAGEYDVDFSGEGLPSGVYIYRLSTGKYTEYKKMILLK